MVDYSIFTRENFELLQCINYKKVVIDNLKFTIYGVRYNENQGCSCSPHIHEYTEFHYIYSGEVETTVNGVVRICGPKQFYLMTPLSIHSHRTLPERNNGYFDGCYQARNRYMVDAADALLAVCREGASGGTQYTVEYAWQKNRELVVIDPDTLERRLLPPRLTAF